eukprot:jgi/Mesen1/8907/ME000540S08422
MSIASLLCNVCPCAVAEGQWLMEYGLSPYAGSAYHGSPLLLYPLPSSSTKSSLLFIIADLLSAVLLRAIGRHLYASLGSVSSGNAPVAAFGWVLSSHLSLYPAILLIPMVLLFYSGPDCLPAGAPAPQTAPAPAANPSQLEPLDRQEQQGVREFGGPNEAKEGLGGDTAPGRGQKLQRVVHREGSAGVSGVKADGLPPSGGEIAAADGSCLKRVQDRSSHLERTGGGRGKQHESLRGAPEYGLRPVVGLLLWSLWWSACVLGACGIALRQRGGLWQMFPEVYGYVLTVSDLSPNLGLFWYLFTEIFDFFRPFFLFVVHAMVLLLAAPLAIRFRRQPLFLAYVLLILLSLLKAHPSVGDAAAYLALLPLFAPQLSGFRLFYVVFFGYLYVAVMGPVMYNLWIWQGTGNSNFFFAVGLVYACVQAILLVESVNVMLKYLHKTKLALKADGVDSQ